VNEPLAAVGEALRRFTTAGQHPLGRQQAFHAHRTARVDSPSTDTHLGSQPEPVAVRHPRARVVEHARTVHTLQEFERRRLVRGDYAVGVAAAVAVDVLDGGLGVLDQLDRQR